MEGGGRVGRIGGKQKKRTLKRDKEKAVRTEDLGNGVQENRKGEENEKEGGRNEKK